MVDGKPQFLDHRTLSHMHVFTLPKSVLELSLWITGSNSDPILECEVHD